MTRTRAVLLALLASASLLLTGCIGPFAPIAMDKSIDTIYTIEFSQSQAVLDFDDGEYTIGESDPEIAAFQQLLRDHGVEPWDYRPTVNDGCTGGVSTTLTVLYRGAGTSDLLIDGCAAAEDSFEAQATALFTEARLARTETLGNDGITSLVFSQQQAIEGFDTSAYTQDAPQQVARFVALLDENDVVWSEGVDEELLGIPCPGSITTSITVIYADAEAPSSPVQIGGCSDVAFIDEVTALFSEWRVALAG